MRILLDTHVAVWLAEGSRRLGLRARRRIDLAARSGGVAISAITFWEVGVLAQKGRLQLPQGLGAWREVVLSQPGMTELAVSSEIAVAAVDLPGSFHADPADRLIVATSRVTETPLLTVDERILAYAGQGHIRIVDG